MPLRSRPASNADGADAPPAPAPTIDILLDRLRTAEPASERRAAALELGYQPAAAADLAAALPTETSPLVCEAIFTALVGIGGEPVAAALAGLLRSEDVALRNGAIEALQQIGPAVTTHVERLLVSPDADTRIFAVAVLEAAPHDRARERLRLVLETDPEVNVGLAAVELLAQLGRPEDEAALLGFRARFPDESFVAFAVATALRQIGAGGAM